MKHEDISVTEASRNFAECVNRARYQNTTFVLHKNGMPVARLVPDNAKRCTGRQLAEALSRVRLSGEELESWRRDLKAARKSLKPPVDKWQ
jgi:antitoxin (DNA-binding transcriptional repressor) of toxin-antitoxin stability system